MPATNLIRLKSFTQLAQNVDMATNAFIDYSKAKNLSPRTIEFYECRLQAFRHYITEIAPDTTPEGVTPALIREFVMLTRQNTSVSTANHNLDVLRNFFGFLVKDGLLAENPALVVDKLRQRKTIIETFTEEQAQALLATCDKSFCGIRDKALMLLLLDTGIRVNELATLEIESVSWSEQLILVLGKGNKERQVPFGLGVRKALNAYLTRRGEVPNQPLLFVTQYGETMDRCNIRLMFRRKAKQAGVTGVRVSAHTFRHTFAKRWLLNGGDAFSLQKILGHTTMEMVRNYVNLAQEDVKTLHRRFSPVDGMKQAKTTGRKRIR